jgi:uncharacterized membrane protein
VSGFGLMIVQYYLHAKSYLIDPAVMPLDPWQAIAISRSSRCWRVGRSTRRCAARRSAGNTTVLAALVFVLILRRRCSTPRVFSARGAFLHVGAFVGTIMAFNVFMVIIPNQRKMVAQITGGAGARCALRTDRQAALDPQQLPDAAGAGDDGVAALSVPLAHPQSWLVVALIIIAGALIRHFSTASMPATTRQVRLDAAAAAFALICAIWLTAPRAPAATARVSDRRCSRITAKHCTMCHARKPTHESFKEAPKNVVLETTGDCASTPR